MITATTSTEGDVVPDVSIVVATYNRAELLPRALASLLLQEGCDIEVVVVDDGSTDGTADMLRHAVGGDPERLRSVRCGANSGPATARNIGWRLASAEWIAFTDDDCEPDPRWASSLLAAARTDGVDIVQGRTVPNPEHATPGCWARSARVESFSHRYQTCNLLVRRSVLEALDGFDETFPFAGEDADLGWRARKAGHAATFAEAALVHHAVRACSFAQHLRDRATWAQLARFIKRHPEARSLLYWRIFYRRSHVAFLAGAPTAIALGFGVGWWVPPVLLVGLVTYRTARTQPGPTLWSRTAYAAQSVVSTAWEVVQFVRYSARHRTLLL